MGDLPFKIRTYKVYLITNNVGIRYRIWVNGTQYSLKQMEEIYGNLISDECSKCIHKCTFI